MTRQDAETLRLSPRACVGRKTAGSAGIVFMAYLNGHQDHFTMVGGQESARSTLHLAELFRLADKAGLFADPELATRRMQAMLAVRGLEA